LKPTSQNTGHMLPVTELMATSQQLVATQTLRAVGLEGVSHLMDIGGGTGAFLTAVASQYRQMKLTLFDLPAVTDEARRRLDLDRFENRIRVVGGSFLDDPLPLGVDALISDFIQWR